GRCVRRCRLFGRRVDGRGWLARRGFCRLRRGGLEGVRSALGTESDARLQFCFTIWAERFWRREAASTAATESVARFVGRVATGTARLRCRIDRRGWRVGRRWRHIHGRWRDILRRRVLLLRRLRPVLLELWRERARQRSRHNLWRLLAHQSVDCVEYLIAQCCLLDRARA